jgi:hypothetical protein
MTKIAFIINPLDWRIGWVNAYDDEGVRVGEWFLIGPLAFCWD